jgi:hypothetical protein
MFCNKTFLNKGNLTRHINLYCEKKNELIKEKLNIDKIKDKEIKFLRKNVLDFIKHNSEKYGNIYILQIMIIKILQIIIITYIYK